MAHRTVQLIIGRILADEEFRDDFLEHPAGTLEALRERGLELTDAEAAALVETDRGLWTFGSKRLDARLQRCRLTARASDGRLLREPVEHRSGRA